MAMHPRPVHTYRVGSIGLPAKEPHLCGACRADIHRDCDLHMNDDAHDAEDFMFVRCDCACRGEVRHDHKLIDIVAELRASIEDEGKRLERHETAQARNAAIAGLREVVSLLEEAVNDEGKLLTFSPARNWERFVSAARIAAVRALATVDGRTAEPEPDEADGDAEAILAPRMTKDEITEIIAKHMGGQHGSDWLVAEDIADAILDRPEQGTQDRVVRRSRRGF